MTRWPAVEAELGLHVGGLRRRAVGLVLAPAWMILADLHRAAGPGRPSWLANLFPIDRLDVDRGAALLLLADHRDGFPDVGLERMLVLPVPSRASVERVRRRPDRERVVGLTLRGRRRSDSARQRDSDLGRVLFLHLVGGLLTVRVPVVVPILRRLGGGSVRG